MVYNLNDVCTTLLLGTVQILDDYRAGAVIGIDHFGASAPAGELYEKFGLTAERMATEATKLVRGDS